ncbi:MAG: maleylacetoacetate isomerase [Gammaproteobacteria bacterium]|nr:MAG: maleylacetoacetate isomerase [Gammaproteobacteria bacterium]
MITLYGYWRSTAAYRVRIALNFKQIAYLQTSIDLVKDGGQQYTKEYLTLNPQALVPTLVDGNFTLSQSMAILEYLEDKYSQVKLLPKNIELKARVRQLSQVISADIHPLNNLRVLKYMTNSLSISEDEKMAWYHHWLEKGFDAFEELLKDHEFTGNYAINGELSMADVCLIPQMYNARRFEFSLDNYPRLVEIEQFCLSLNFVKDAVPENQPDAKV